MNESRISCLAPLRETVKMPVDILGYFNALREGKRHTFLFETLSPTGDAQIIGSHDPSLKISGSAERFRIEALNAFGKTLLPDIASRLPFCEDVKIAQGVLEGSVRNTCKGASGDELMRLKLQSQADVLRAIAFAYVPLRASPAFGGLIGAFSYDFIDQFEELPNNKADLLELPDYLFYYADNLFFAEPGKDKLQFIANAIVVGDEEEAHERCLRKISEYRSALTRVAKVNPETNTSLLSITSDTTQEEFEALVMKMKEHIAKGDVFQAVPSRTLIAEGAPDAFETYKSLHKINPSPYMFFFDFGDHQLVGSSPEVAIRVTGGSEKTVEIRPIAGTRPRGFDGERRDADLDSRYETELKTDRKELAEHMMLVDLARNDIAKVSIPGTRVVTEPVVIEKYSHVQHLVSSIKGTLKPGLDALHAYVATMNMGTVCGAPKIEAMKILRREEKTKRGYYGGAVACFTPDGNFDSGLIIRTLVFKGGKAYLRVGAGIVQDSLPEREYLETEHKARACLTALKEAAR
ncbi:MAG: anthranilate synthase component I family protein [Nanoarchaeota archaeon]|nr:anthranilate synthase component I family protein [Nanoarchaeota archaeon]